MGSAFIVVFLIQISLVACFFKFLNVECDNKDPQVLAIEECRIRAFNRSENYLNIIVNLRRTLKLKVSFRFIKRERGGWHPFLYAMTVDICKFFDGSFKNPLPTIIYNYLVGYTNLNHSCPYMANTYIKLLRLNLNELDILSRFPLEDGVYGIQSSWYSNNKLFLYVNASATLAKSYKKH